MSIHNYFWGGWPEMPWKKEEEVTNIWPNPDVDDWEPDEEDDREED